MLGFGSGLQMWVHTKFYDCPMLETIQEVARLCCTTYAGGGNSRNLTCTCDDGTLPLSIVHRPRRPPCRGNGARIQFPPPQPQMPLRFPPPSVRVRGTDGSEGRRMLQGCNLPSQVGVSEEFAHMNDRSFVFPQYPVSPPFECPGAGYSILRRKGPDKIGSAAY